jgi:hypothetical protein
MDWLMIIEVTGGIVLAFGVALALGLWLFDVQSAPQRSDRFCCIERRTLSG